LECQAARLYCGDPVRARYAELESLAEKLDEAIARDSEHWEYEMQFHGLLVSLSKSKVLTNEYYRVVRLGTFYNMHRVAIDMRRAGEVVDNQSHVELLPKLLNDDPDQVERIIRDHVHSGKRRLFNHTRPS
ncbi:MAG TPA: FCD domain-containing protein, partial [Spirochaetia bacterium]|nr:FCD domain-containing protein [Spirochaetia bacterium]